MVESSEFWEKEEKNSKVWWLKGGDYTGKMIFSFDKKKRYDLFNDYPQKLTEEEREVFKESEPIVAKIHGYQR